MNSANTTKSSHTKKANDIQPEINVSLSMDWKPIFFDLKKPLHLHFSLA